MCDIAVVFMQAPHGSSAGREGLDAVLAMSALSEDIGLFFIGDGVLQLQCKQEPQCISARHYALTFGVLPLYDIDNFYVCADSLATRGVSMQTEWIIPAEILFSEALKEKLSASKKVIIF
ncbi:MAG: Protein TusC [Candidatus Erwinia impunctatus]|nr:Protein TusC [Culicoides impunctatus]